MKHALEIRIPPSGNHRNQDRIIIGPGEPNKRGHVCPRCSAKLQARTQTFPTAEYKKFRSETVEAILAKYSKGQFMEPVVVYVWIMGGRGFRENRDWDNTLKCIGDSLVDSGILPIPTGPDLASGNEREGADDVRGIKGWRTYYFTRKEHVDLTKGAAGKADDINARIFVQIIEASTVQPFAL
jgi:hypothetical protein